MNKIMVVFFLSLLIALPVQAEVEVQVTPDYKVSEILTLQKATAFTFDFEGNFIVAEDQGRSFQVSKVSPDGTKQVLLERTGQQITNLSYYQGIVYVVSRGQIYKIAKGKISDVINSLPTYGDYANSNLVFWDGSMYFAIGTATNSAIVGNDNAWLKSYPSVHDISCGSITLSGTNVQTQNFLTEKKDDQAVTGSFMTFNTKAQAGQLINGMRKCNGALIKATPDGNNIQVYAWGLHNPKGLSIDSDGEVWVFDGGMEDRGIRPIKNGKDALYKVVENTWYGWPDFSAGLAVDQPAVLSVFPNNPPYPEAVFDLSKIKSLIVAPKNFPGFAVAQVADDRLQILNSVSKNLQDFVSISNSQIIQYKFGPDGKLYILAKEGSGKSRLFSVEALNPSISTTISTKKSNSTAMNWSFGLLMTSLLGFGYYFARNLKQPLKPL